jgi:hypothetical protein
MFPAPVLRQKLSRPRPWQEIILPPAPFPAAHHLHKQVLPAAMSTHQNNSQGESTTQDPPLTMPCRKIANWTTIRNMCHRRFAAQTAEELEMQAVELARQHTEDKVAAFEREGEVA